MWVDSGVRQGRHSISGGERSISVKNEDHTVEETDDACNQSEPLYGLGIQ